MLCISTSKRVLHTPFAGGALKQVFPFLSITNGKKEEKHDFDQRMVCGATICWSKYTTHTHPKHKQSFKPAMSSSSSVVILISPEWANFDKSRSLDLDLDLLLWLEWPEVLLAGEDPDIFLLVCLSSDCCPPVTAGSTGSASTTL